MGIEPTRESLPELENTRFRVMPTLKCDGGVNFRGTWGNVGMRWSLLGRDFASRPVDAPCGPLDAAAWRSTSQPFARQQDGARHLMLAAGVIRHLPPRQPERFGRIRQAQTVLPTPSDELDRIGPPVLLERDLE